MSRHSTAASPSAPSHAAPSHAAARDAATPDARVTAAGPLARTAALACAIFTATTALATPAEATATTTMAAATAAEAIRPTKKRLTLKKLTRRKLTSGQIAASAALTQLGVSFSWGGGSAKGPTLGIGRGAGTRGFDCSGLTLYAWSRAGVRLSHYTGAQFRQGRRITRAARRAGDLLFFGGGRGDPTHVALYLGGGLMVHAPKTGDVVRTTSFAKSSYFRAVYRGTVRPG
ncbi:Peptidoglycan endopeptidase RipA precursor [Nonomuraea coxensis DSM 45129]|uniref:Peptidoglycan endopeptidase RipA n=1 Tax=Nonomuraea coxensis DSM 45129 TaxID=1122611 RepID=A0ABX8UBB6_9ACTN|nr:NlpC/P60 family protein [Nonomuraea coxensis]QYC45077.1 Peptidoglycan endopeptidase RipA precursor [Nonomuraea coxensis DSM 45129]